MSGANKNGFHSVQLLVGCEMNEKSERDSQYVVAVAEWPKPQETKHK